MTHDKMVHTVALRLNMDEDRVAYIIDRYLRTLSLRLKKRNKLFDNMDEYYKGTYIVNICNICYARYSWREYQNWVKYMKEHKTGLFAEQSKTNDINDK